MQVISGGGAPVIQQHTPDSLPADTIRVALKAALQGKDLNAISVGEIREQMAGEFGFPGNALDGRKKEIRKILKGLVEDIQREAGVEVAVVSLAQQIVDQQAEVATALQEIYLVTISRIHDTTLANGLQYQDLQGMERREIGDAIRDAFDNPVTSGVRGGRPRRQHEEALSVIVFLVVFREHHGDGGVHFHIVVKLRKQMRFAAAKRTLMVRHRLPSHFSCTHTQVWSGIRYLYVETPTKPEVDSDPFQWAADGSQLDLYELSQRPYNAELWRKRRETIEKEASAKKAKTSFNKLDLTSLIISKHLYTKDRLLAYVQNHGTTSMQLHANKNQRRLASDIEDAKEWASAKENAAFEAIEDWDQICQTAEKPCPHGECNYSYYRAVGDIFRRNSSTLDWAALAAALRNIIQVGPKKTTRVPFLVGPSNTGKSTILYPFDDLFMPKRVLHKPALGSSFGLRNLASQHKRFIFWDDYRPVEFAHENTVPVSAFLSLFISKHSEIQISQAFSDGNEDVQWKRGVVFTGKMEGLWEPTKKVSLEDIKHMRNRCREFAFSANMPDGSLKDVESCASCMCRWIVRGAAAHDARLGVQPVIAVLSAGPGSASLDMARVGAIGGLQELLGVLRVSDQVSKVMLEGLENLGAVRVSELGISDWGSLDVWSLLLPLPKRRLLQQIHRVSVASSALVPNTTSV